MALGIYIAVVIIGIIAVVMFKLFRNTSKTSYFGEPSKCRTCGRRSETPNCPFCNSDTKSLR